jgi:phosphomevalonate kinase
VYRRFDASVLASIPQLPSAAQVHSLVTSNAWNQYAIALELPHPLDLMMGDVAGGSSSVSMARAVLQWRERAPVEAARVWSALSVCNLEVCYALEQLNSFSKHQPEDFEAAVKYVDCTSFSDWSGDNDVVKVLWRLKSLFRKARDLLKRMGEAAGVEIEPDSQTELVNATDDINGVICGGVPGAGGVDAVFCIVASDRARYEVETLWSAWTAPTVCPLLLKADSSDREECRGVRVESAVDV